MNEIARMNLQTGIPEDKRYDWTNYTPTCDLDIWIIQHQDILKRVEEYWEQKYQEELERQMEKEIETKVGELIEQKLDDLIKGFESIKS